MTRRRRRHWCCSGDSGWPRLLSRHEAHGQVLSTRRVFVPASGLSRLGHVITSLLHSSEHACRRGLVFASIGLCKDSNGCLTDKVPEVWANLGVPFPPSLCPARERNAPSAPAVASLPNRVGISPEVTHPSTPCAPRVNVRVTPDAAAWCGGRPRPNGLFPPLAKHIERGFGPPRGVPTGPEGNLFGFRYLLCFFRVPRPYCSQQGVCCFQVRCFCDSR